MFNNRAESGSTFETKISSMQSPEAALNNYRPTNPAAEKMRLETTLSLLDEPETDN